MNHDIVTTLRELPGGLAAGESSADDVDSFCGWRVHLFKLIGASPYHIGRSDRDVVA